MIFLICNFTTKKQTFSSKTYNSLDLYVSHHLKMNHNAFLGGFEILGGSQLALSSQVQILLEDKDVVIEDCIHFTEHEKEQLEMIEFKLVWVMQPNINKQQTISLGFLSPKLLDKWLWSQKDVAIKFSDRKRFMFMYGMKEKVQHDCLTFDSHDMPTIITSDWDIKTWEVTDTVTGDVTKYKARMTELVLTYNCYLKELYGKCSWICMVQDKDGKWVLI